MEMEALSYVVRLSLKPEISDEFILGILFDC